MHTKSATIICKTDMQVSLYSELLYDYIVKSNVYRLLHNIDIDCSDSLYISTLLGVWLSIIAMYGIHIWYICSIVM